MIVFVINITKTNKTYYNEENLKTLMKSVQRATGSYHNYLSLVKLLPWFLSLEWKICPWAEHSNDDE